MDWKQPQTVTALCLRFGMLWLLAALGHSRFPWQLSATRRAMMAVLPKPIFPTITTPRLVDGSPLRRQASTSWKSHSLPVNSQSDERPGISKWSGFRLREGVKQTGREEGKEWKDYFSCTACKLVLCMYVRNKCIFVYLWGPVDSDSQNSVWAFWGMFAKECVSAAHPDRLDLQGGQN